MSAPTPPPYGAWVPPPPKPRRRRPRAWWFAVGALLVAGAVVSLGIGILTAVHSVADFVQVDATISDDGQPHDVTVPTDGDRMLWMEDRVDVGSCDVVDTATGAAVAMRRVSGDYLRSDDSGDWVGVARFDPGSGDLEVTCPSGGGRGQIGPSAEISHVVKSLVLVVLVPLVLGGLGTIALVVTGILWATGAPRHDQPGPGPDDTVVRPL
jgi:hypothetical protein